MYPRPDFFPSSTLNFAENLLYPAALTDPSQPAVIEANETSTNPISWTELRDRVRRCTLALQNLSLGPGDRVAGFLGNTANAVIAALAAASIGVVWTGVSPDTGVHAVLERLVQIEPKVLFVDNGVGYNGRTHPSGVKARGIVEGLKGKGLKAVVVFETVKGLDCGVENLAEAVDEGAKAWKYDDFVDRYVGF
jgi:acetoacetyl-CoA synthetase